jgi:hypothetical protein
MSFTPARLNVHASNGGGSPGPASVKTPAMNAPDFSLSY